MDGTARILPGKMAAGAEEDRDGDGDTGRYPAIPCTRLKRTTRRSYCAAWPGEGRLGTVAMRRRRHGRVSRSWLREMERERKSERVGGAEGWRGGLSPLGRGVGQGEARGARR